jgi:hypothetical protein
VGPDDFGIPYIDCLYDPERMAAQTSYDCAMYARLHGKEADFAACGLWLSVGLRDKHYFHLCCDRASPLFGTLADKTDSHPWIWPPHSTPSSEIETRCFLDFLRRAIAEEEHDEPGN